MTTSSPSYTDGLCATAVPVGYEFYNSQASTVEVAGLLDRSTLAARPRPRVTEIVTDGPTYP
jgi:hypothetical protein